VGRGAPGGIALSSGEKSGRNGLLWIEPARRVARAQFRPGRFRNPATL